MSWVSNLTRFTMFNWIESLFEPEFMDIPIRDDEIEMFFQLRDADKEKTDD